eukprot:g9198.t1
MAVYKKSQPSVLSHAMMLWRCQFPVEIGVRLQAPCRLQEIVIASEPNLAPSAVECFVAGPVRSMREAGDKRASATLPQGIDQRHNGSTSAATDAARTAYLSSVFVRAGRAEFSPTNTGVTGAHGIDSSRTEESRQKSMAHPTDSATVTPSVAVLSGLTFKGQFLRLVLWEALGSRDNPGRQPALQKRAGAAGGIPSYWSEGGDGDELEQVLLDLGIEPFLAQVPSGNEQARDRGGRHDVSRGSPESSSAYMSGRKGWEGAARAAVDAEDAVAAEAMKKVKQMLHIARTEERFHAAEMLSLQLDRVRSLASKLVSARRAQERAARRENFDQAKRFRDDAREAEVWLLQTVRDASLGEVGDVDGEAAKAGESSIPGKKSKDVGSKARIKAGGRESRVAISGVGSQPLTHMENEEAEGAVSHRGGDHGRAFGHLAADSSPAATHVVNFIEDNPGLVWSSSALRGPWRRSVQHVQYVRGNDHDSGHDEATRARESEAVRRNARGKRRRSLEYDEEITGEGARMRSKRRGGGDRKGGPGTAVDLDAEAAAGERVLDRGTAPLTSAAAVLPDVVGAGGFAEFIPLLETIFGRVPMSAACAEFPARVRESSIRICQAHLELTADAAVKACMAATVSSPVSTTVVAAQRTTSSSYPQRGSETGDKRDPRAEIRGELKRENSESLYIRRAHESSSSSSSGAIGAVVRATCLVAAQGLMDAKREVRLAGADLARSAFSLGSSMSAAGLEGAWDNDQDDHIASDNHAIGNAAGRKGSVGVDDDEVGNTTRKSEAASDSEDAEHPQTPPSAYARIDSEGEGHGSSRSSVSYSPASASKMKVRTVVPLRDLRWGLELVLACVAPYLTDRAVVSNESRGDGVTPTTGGSVVGHIDNNSGCPPTGASINSRGKSVSASDRNNARSTGDWALPAEENGSENGRKQDDTDEREELALPTDGEDSRDDGERSLLALYVVDFACRHPDIGPALVSSILVGWIPCLAQWGRNDTLPSVSSLDPNHRKAGHASVPRKPRCAAFTVGEAAALEALASGAIEMIVYMVKNFPLLPLSDFSAETLVAAAEGGMAFAADACSTSADGVNGRRRDRGERRRGGKPAGGWRPAVAAAARGAAERRTRGSQRSSTKGRAKKAGEALMLELLLRTSGSAHGRLDLGSTSKEDAEKVCLLARDDSTPRVYPHMSHSSSAEGLSASTGKSAEASVVSEGGGDGAAATLGDVPGDEDSSSFASYSHGSLSSTSLEEGSEPEAGSNIGSAATGRKPREVARETTNDQAVAAKGSAQGVKSHKDASSAKQTLAANGNKKSTKVFPMLSLGGKKSKAVEEPARDDVGDKIGLGNAEAATVGERPLGKPAGEAVAKNGGSGFMSRLFGRGKK